LLLRERGVVVDERRQPIAGAVVWLGTRAGDGTPLEVVTGDDGVFTAAIAAGADARVPSECAFFSASTAFIARSIA